MGLFDSLKNMFAHHEHHHGASIGQPLTLTDTKAVLAFIVLHQHLADMRKVAEAVKQLQDEMPQYITFGMSDDNRGQLFLALFQGFPFLGNLPITLVFHEAPTGTQE